MSFSVCVQIETTKTLISILFIYFLVKDEDEGRAERENI
jgi:hypothetical protein